MLAQTPIGDPDDDDWEDDDLDEDSDDDDEEDDEEPMQLLACLQRLSALGRRYAVAVSAGVE